MLVIIRVKCYQHGEPPTRTHTRRTTRVASHVFRWLVQSDTITYICGTVWFANSKTNAVNRYNWFPSDVTRFLVHPSCKRVRNCVGRGLLLSGTGNEMIMVDICTEKLDLERLLKRILILNVIKKWKTCSHKNTEQLIATLSTTNLSIQNNHIQCYKSRKDINNRNKDLTFITKHELPLSITFCVWERERGGRDWPWYSC